MKKNQSAILETVHQTAQGLHRAGAMNQLTMWEFDRLCLHPVELLQPEQIKQIREVTSAGLLFINFQKKL
jgi:putative transcriptional regulator